ncbi:MAG: hypothetical protein HQ508_04165 [Candidatus Marinimicrobia bacterium]|nr:hypothetical protein [Candidatus Neomarinimicrobiota bacterium]
MMINYILKVVSLTFFAVSVFAIEGSWVERSPMPERRLGHAVASIGAHIYISGGVSSPTGMHETHSQLWAYDYLLDTWITNLPSLPEPRVDHTMTALGDTLWVFGGRNQNSIISAVLFWVEGTDQWQYATELPYAREGMRSIIHNGYVYLIGGKASHSMWTPPTARVDRFNPQTYTWSVIDSLNQARVGFAIAAHGDTVVCIGGRFIDPLASVEYGMLGGAWQMISPLIVPRSNCSAVYYQNEFVLIGGLTPGGQANNNLSYDGSNWFPFEGNLLPRHDSAVQIAGLGILVMGGRNGGQALNTVEYFLPTVGVRREDVIPENFSSIKTFPNPFNGSAIIELSLPGVGDIPKSLIIYNIRGEEVLREPLPEFQNMFTTYISGDKLGQSGVYLAVFNYRTSAGERVWMSQKLILLQ